MERRVVFPGWVFPLLLLAPQLAVTLVFFFWPAGQALLQSVQRGDAFGLSTRFVGLENFAAVLTDPFYLASVEVTLVFSLAVAVLALTAGLVFAVMADQIVRGTAFYKTVLLLPYAVAPAIAGVLWLFLFNPSVGIVAAALRRAGVDWNFLLNGRQALLLVILAAAWKQVSYNTCSFWRGYRRSQRPWSKRPRSTAPAQVVDFGGSSFRCWHPPAFFCWWSTSSMPSSTPSGSFTM